MAVPSDQARSLVIVPPGPGPLREIGGGTEKERDEIDVVLDELFGEVGSEKPSAFDVVLLSVGVVVIVVSWLGKLSPFIMALGWIAVALGAVLPLRSLWVGATHRASAAKVRQQMAGATVLNIGHPTSAALVAAYQRVASLASSRQNALATAGFEAAHLAALEVGGLLKGQPPSTPAEVEYVDSRAVALDALATRLERELPPTQDEASTELEVRDATVRSMQAVEERSGWSSLTELRSLNKVLDDLRPA